ncbi:MAG: hypothetical protein QM636_22550 [Rhizobium sp.]
MKPTSNARSGKPGETPRGLMAIRHFLGKQERVYLWTGCLCCNLVFRTIGASPRQFIIFNILTLLALAAKTLEALSVETGKPSAATGNRPPAARDWRPILSFAIQLLVACYAMTVLVDNLATSPALLGTAG